MSSIRIAMLSLGIASLSLVACAGEDSSAAGESNLTNAGPTPSVAAPVDGIAACAGRTSCVNAFVMKTLLSSNLQLTEMFQGETPITHAGEYVIDWMQPPGDKTFSTLRIEPTPLGGGKYKVEIGLGNKDIGEDGTESGCHFSFTIDHDKVVEPQVKGFCAG